MEITLVLPSLDDLFGWFVAWFCFGVIFNVIHAVSFVVCDYGRTARQLPHLYGLLMVFADSLFWPANIRNIKMNLSYNKFNRGYKYYRSGA